MSCWGPKGTVTTPDAASWPPSPHWVGHARGPQVHDGTFVSEKPNRMRRTGATPARTRKDGVATVFVAGDHVVSDMVASTPHGPGRGSRP